MTEEERPSSDEVGPPERPARATLRMLPAEAEAFVEQASQSEASPSTAPAPSDPPRAPFRASPSASSDRPAPAVITLRCTACDRTYSASHRFCPFDGAPLDEASAMEAPADPLIGKTVADRYEVEAVLGHGGMGTVYSVRHTKLESSFAMKVLHPDLLADGDVAPRLIAEARATAAIGHPNIVTVSDFGEIDATVLPELGDERLPYFVMEQLSGPSLSQVLEDEGPLSKERVAQLALQIAGALAAAHKAGIVHRDLKPENIRIARDDVGREIAKVLDFGVAKVIGASKKTQQGMVFGTPFYMSPEQAGGDAIDARTDVYALGVIMFECLVGDVPFHADTFMGVLQMHLFEAVPKLDNLKGRIPLEPILQRCLEKNPDVRYQSMGEVVAAIEGIIGARKATQTGRWMAIEAPPQNDDAKRWLWAGLTVLVAAAVAFMVVRYAGQQPASSAAASSVEAPGSAPPSVSAAPPPPPVAPPEPSVSVSAAPPAPPPSAAPPPVVAPPPPAAPPPAPVPVAPPPSPRPRPGGDVVDPWG